MAAPSRTSSVTERSTQKLARERASSASAVVEPVTVTLAPSSASALPIAAPMPLVPPEISATLSRNASSWKVAAIMTERAR